jgi:hypothetical protein
MPTCLITTVLALLCASPVRAQDAVPVIRAHSRVVTITDGLHVKKNYWYVMPDKRPDVYFVEIPLEPHTVTFTTDVESIHFPVTYGSQHEFVIRLDEGVEARTQVRAAFRSLLSYRRTGLAPAGGVDTIPFTLGNNDKIYVKGRLNGGPVLDFQFDLGAGGGVIKKGSVPKARMQFDGTVRLRNSDGDNVVPSSSANRLEVAALAWDTVPFVVADNMTWREDALIGNALFQDKVLEIDYDRMVIAIRDTLPALSPEWSKQDMILDGVVPYVRGTLSIDDVPRNGWFLLDTGAYTSILNSERLSAFGKVSGELWRMLGGRHRGPALWIAGRVFGKPNYSVGPYNGDRSALGLLGNDVLKRFNLIVDNRRGFAYFRPNHHLDASFRNPEYYLVRFLALAMVAVGVAVAWLVRRKRAYSAGAVPFF